MVDNNMAKINCRWISLTVEKEALSLCRRIIPTMWQSARIRIVYQMLLIGGGVLRFIKLIYYLIFVYLIINLSVIRIERCSRWESYDKAA